jgi:NADH-quinone oxidoreductase subunit G
MEIYTATPGVKQMREGVLEALLINHPLDCPICDQAGECKLQEYSVDYGQAQSRFVEAKVHKPKAVDLGPRIVLDAERCILCTRCIRFTKDIAGDDALGIINRGSYNTIATFPGTPFANNYTLNTVDICPVGALTSKDFRFQMRVWFLKETRSLCTSCGTGCNIVVGSREEKIHRYEPRENDAVNSSWMCDAGRLNYKWVARDDRLEDVLVRKAGQASSLSPPEVGQASSLSSPKVGQASSLSPPEVGQASSLSSPPVDLASRLPSPTARQAGSLSYVKSTWANALGEISEKLRKATAGSVAVIASARQTNEELFLLKKIATKLNAISDSVPRVGAGDRLLVDADKNPNSNGARLTGLAATPMGSQLTKIAEGIKSGAIKTLIVVGEDVTKHGIGTELLGKLETLIVSDILPNQTTGAAHYLLPGCAHVEKRGSFTNIKGRVQRFLKAVEAKGDARPEWEFLHELVYNVTGQDGFVNIEGLFNQMAAEVPAFRGVTWAGLGDKGVTVAI